MVMRLEHANMIVRDLDGMIEFVQTAFPFFKVRWEAKTPDGRRSVHIGTDDTYLALSEASKDRDPKWKPYAGEPGVNHLGFEVDDVDSLEARMTAAGYQNSTPENAHPHRKRVYFLDRDGNDWEFVQYYSDDPAERNDYTIDN